MGAFVGGRCRKWKQEGPCKLPTKNVIFEKGRSGRTVQHELVSLASFSGKGGNSRIFQGSSGAGGGDGTLPITKKGDYGLIVGPSIKLTGDRRLTGRRVGR